MGRQQLMGVVVLVVLAAFVIVTAATRMRDGRCHGRGRYVDCSYPAAAGGPVSR
ncbi:hypothetical protein [Phenylobacterium sp.]|uniref:hypothetical protein n=1 Tax=Phenylobacterium sp. TaxID=1871053 RepID=UPI0025CE66F7|nr:hypothetical protein [Phenylobacterium sp.]